MRERFARWVLLMLALALALVGRPDGSRDRDSSGEEALKAGHDDLSLMSEQRRAPGVQTGGDGERQTKPGTPNLTDCDLVAGDALAIAAAYSELEWADAWSWRGSDAFRSAVSARGPPAHRA